MKKLLWIVVLGSLLFLQTSNVNAHEDLDIGHKKHDPITCKLPEDRTWFERKICELNIKKHRLCKLDQYCAILKIEQLEKEKKEILEENKELKDKLNQ